MFRNTFFASVIALGAAGAAQAQAPDTTGLAVAAAGGNTVGGAAATIVGGGDNLVILYSGTGAGPGGALQAQAPRLARARNSYGGVAVEYLEPETCSGGPRGLGGGRRRQRPGGLQRPPPLSGWRRARGGQRRRPPGRTGPDASG